MAILLAACGSSSSTPPTPQECKATFEMQLDRTCTTSSDCVLAESTDCCGPVEYGVRAGTQDQFAQIEASYVACLACPPLGCDHAPITEGGQTPSANQSIAAVCILDACKAVVQ